MIELFQHYSKYARFNPVSGTRETWADIVDRNLGFYKGKYSGKGGENIDWDFLKSMMLQEKATFSMRSVQMAGKPSERCNVSIYNCAYTPIEHHRDMADSLYIMMQGTGLAFSVERAYTEQLPVVAPYSPSNPRTHFTVNDTTESWCDALYVALESAFKGRDVSFDVRQVRPKGARLATKGGYASGPEPLIELLAFVRTIIMGAAGRRLRPFEVHRIMCKIGQIVQVGGVRRAAMLSLSDVDDEEMRQAKNGAFWDVYPELSMANNSAAYNDEDSWAHFPTEFANLVASGSGERGIFNRSGIRPARRTKARYGTNPCVAADTIIETANGPARVKDLIGIPFDASINGLNYKSTADGFFKTGTKDVYKLTTRYGRTIRLTSDHKVYTLNRGKVPACELTTNDRIAVGLSTSTPNSGSDAFDKGWLLGSFLGDGTVSGNSVRLSYWKGDDACADHAYRTATRLFGPHTKTGPSHRSDIHSRPLYRLADTYGLVRDGRKHFSSDIEFMPNDMLAGLLRGWFDADGTVTGTTESGFTVRLWSTQGEALQAAQRILGRFGIDSKVFFKRKDACMKNMPDGHGGLQAYECKAGHELIVSSKNIDVFARVIGFKHSGKAARLTDAIHSTNFYNKPTFDIVDSLVLDGHEDVYDCTIPGPHVYTANGLIVSNCGEILLRPRQFCNLSIAIVRPEDTLQDLEDKVRAATIMGTLQAGCTDFRYIDRRWSANCKEEALLGVDLQGALDNPLLQDPETLALLKGLVISTNVETAQTLGIRPSAATTCIKPSGNSGERFSTGNSITGWFAPYYMRRVYVQKDEPMYRFLHDQGVPHEAHYIDSSVEVFVFPKKAPDNAVIRGQVNAIGQLNWWKVLKTCWTEHNPSATIYVKEDEWSDVQDWVLTNRDIIGGLAFLPYSDSVYTQAPFTAVSAEDYNQALEAFPTIDWARLRDYDLGIDTTVAGQQFACLGDSCSIG